MGWYTEASGGTKVGNGGDSYTPSNSTTLYAHWESVTYSVTYNSNGGVGEMTKQTFTHDVSNNLEDIKYLKLKTIPTYGKINI